MGDKLIEGVKEVRNLLSHGADIHEITLHMRKTSPDFELEKAVDIMANFAQEALHRALDLPAQDPPLTFYFLESREHVSVTQRAHLTVETKGDPLDPKFEDVWLPELSVVVTDPTTGEEEHFGPDGRPNA